MTLEEDPTVRMEPEKPPLGALAAAPPKTARPLLAVLFAVIVVLSIGALWLGLSSHWQAFSRNAVFALPQSQAVVQRRATPPAAAADQTQLDVAELKRRLAAIDTRVAALERSAKQAPRVAAPAPQGAPPAPQGLPTIVPPKARESANAGGTLPVQ